MNERQLEHVSKFNTWDSFWMIQGMDGAESPRKVASGRKVIGFIISLVNAKSLQF